MESFGEVQEAHVNGFLVVHGPGDCVQCIRKIIR